MTFDCEPPAVHRTVENFRHVLDGRKFTVLTDLLILICAFRKRSDKHWPRELRHLDFFTQFSSNVSGAANIVGDALSRVNVISNQPKIIDLDALTATQRSDLDGGDIRENTSLTLTESLGRVL